jgi:hypothetical protein
MLPIVHNFAPKSKAFRRNILCPFYKQQKTASPFGDAVIGDAEIRLHAQPYWNGGIWYKRTHGTEFR